LFLAGRFVPLVKGGYKEDFTPSPDEAFSRRGGFFIFEISLDKSPTSVIM
jgi:hypothetical protein